MGRGGPALLVDCLRTAVIPAHMPKGTPPRAASNAGNDTDPDRPCACTKEMEL